MIARYRSSFAASTGFVAARPPARVIEAGRATRAINSSQLAAAPACKRGGRPGDINQRSPIKNSA